MKKSLLQAERLLTPKQRVDLRKKERADKEAERIKQAVVQNYNEARKRYKEHRKKQVKDIYFLCFHCRIICLVDESGSTVGGGTS